MESCTKEPDFNKESLQLAFFAVSLQYLRNNWARDLLVQSGVSCSLWLPATTYYEAEVVFLHIAMVQ